MRRLTFFLFIIFLCFCISAQAQNAKRDNSATPLSPLSDNYVREWLIIGPFSPDDLSQDFLADTGGEANANPKAGDSVKIADGSTVSWKLHKSPEDIINLLNAIGKHYNSIAYAFCILQSEADIESDFFIGSDDGVTVWVNGKQVHHNSIGRHLSPDDDAFRVNLKKGNNACLVKISQIKGNWEFIMRASTSINIPRISGIVTDQSGIPVDQVTVSLEKNYKEIARGLTDASGKYEISISGARGNYDLLVNKANLGDMRLNIPLSDNADQNINLSLRNAINIQGSILMMDNMTPHVSVPVQAVRNGVLVATAISDEKGKYNLVNLKAGMYRIRCQVKNGYAYYGGNKTVRSVSSAVPVWSEPGRIRGSVDLRFPSLKKGTWRNYTYLDGLPSRKIHAIQGDPDKGVWLATADGVYLYDGNEFVGIGQEHGLAGVWVLALHRDPDGVIWLGTWNHGVFRYDGKTLQNLTTKDGLADDTVWCIHRESENALWFGTGSLDSPGNGVSRYDGKSFTNFSQEDGLVENTILSMCRDLEGNMWFGSRWKGISRYDGEKFTSYTAMEGLSGNTVSAIYCDPDGNLWFGTYGGVSKYDGKIFANLTIKDGLPNPWVTSINQGNDGALWFGTGYSDYAGGGVSRYNGKTFVNFAVQDGLAHNSVVSIYVDPGGILWFGTDGGVSTYDESTFTNFTTKDGLASNVIWHIYGDPEGSLWFGTDGGGASSYDGSEFINYTTQNGLAYNQVCSIQRTADGDLWFGTRWNGVSRYDGKKFINFGVKDGLGSERVMSGYHDPDDNLWFATRGGVTHYNGKEFVNLTVKSGLVNDWVFSAYRDSAGSMWFGTENGLSRYDGKDFLNFTTKDGLAGKAILSIYGDTKGNIWLGTYGNGISRYDGKSFTNFSVSDGLSHDAILAIHQTGDGTMWFGTEGGGVSLYDGKNWASLDTRDGLAGNNVYSIHQDADGTLWFGTDGGITHYRINENLPKVHITSVTASEKSYRDLPALPSIPIGKYVSIDYGAIDFQTVSDKRQYRFRIKELDSDWRKFTKSTQFGWLPEKPGNYTFEVQAISRDLKYSKAESLKLVIAPPPFYKRGWFIIALILAAFLIPTIIYAILLPRREKREFEPISNPYIVGNPVQTKDMFFGRENEFKFVRMKLSSEQTGIAIVLAGERRIGISSILFQIIGGELGEYFVPVLLDMQSMVVDSEAEFFGKIASEIEESLIKSAVRSRLKPDVFHKENPAKAFESYIDSVLEALDNKFLLLMLDDYDLIESKIDQGILKPEIIAFLAGILESRSRLSFIFAGSQRLGQRNRAYWKVMIGKSLYRRISFLELEDALRLITEPLKDQVIYPHGTSKSIVRLTAGHPFYTQVLCKNLVDRLNEVERNRVAQADIEAVANELANNPLPLMVSFWDNLETNQQNALSLLGEVLQNADQYASAQKLVTLASKKKITLNMDATKLEKIMDELSVKDVLERERVEADQYEYRFRADLLRIWLRRAQSPGQIQE